MLLNMGTGVSIQVFVNTPPPTNQAPVAISESIITDEDIAKSIKLNATDADNDALTYSIFKLGFYSRRTVGEP